MATHELILDTSGASKNERILDDVRQAITRLSTASEEQFQEIKKEKWFHRLWDMVTLSSKKEIRMAEQITTLAQAQEGLIKILVILSAQNQEISDLVRENFAAVKKLQKNDIYLLNRLKDLENEVYGFRKAVKIAELSPLNKKWLNSCLYYLSQKFEYPSERQKEYANAVLSLVDNDDCRTDGVDNTEAALERNLRKIEPAAKECILMCCCEYIYLNRQNEDDFIGDICKDIIKKLDVGQQTVVTTERMVIDAERLRGAKGIIKKYESPTVSSVSDTFTIDLDLDLDAEAEPVLAQPHEFPEIEECIKEHTKDALLGESLPKKGQKSEKKQLTKEELLEILLPQNTPIAKTVVAITAAGKKTKKEKKKNDPLEYEEYLVFTTFALYHILDGKASKLPYEQITYKSTKTDLSVDKGILYCGDTKFCCKHISAQEIGRFCQRISKIENKPRSDIKFDLTGTEFEVYSIGFSRIAAQIVRGKDGRSLHELYRILTSKFGLDFMERWPIISEKLDTPIEIEISEWKKSLVYPCEESSCEDLVRCICQGILYLEGSNTIAFEDSDIFQLICGSSADKIQKSTQSERMEIIKCIDGIGSNTNLVQEIHKTLKKLTVSYDQAISTAKRFGAAEMQKKLEHASKKLKKINAGLGCIEKWSKKAQKIGLASIGSIPFIHGMCSKMLKELNEIFDLPTLKRIGDNAFVDAFVGAIMTPFMAVPIIGSAAAAVYVAQVGERYLGTLVTVIEKSTEDEVKNADLLEKRLQIALQECAESASKAPQS